MSRFISTALVLALAASTNDFAACQNEGEDALDCQMEILDEEAGDMNTQLLQTKLELTKNVETEEAEPNILETLRMETRGAATAEQVRIRQKIDAMEAEARAAAAVKDKDEKETAQVTEKKQADPQKPKHAKGGDNKILQEAMIPAGALFSGALLLAMQQTTAGLLAIYFGAQAGFSLYMKVVLSNAVISKELGIQGIPAGFLVTAIQQIVAFLVMAAVVVVLYFTPFRYTPRKLNSFREFACVILFSFAFALNIGLNNFSLSLLAVSLNMIIRSCLPLVTLVLQQMLGPCIPGIAGKVRGVEVVLMVAGVVFAGLATLAKSESSHSGNESKNLVMGVLMCLLSDVAAAVNLILAAMFGSTLNPPLNPVDTIFYMAVPCGLFLLPASIMFLHPVEWPGFGQITDYQVYQKVMELSPTTMGWVILSGFIAAAYNVLQYTVVQRLSAGHAAFAGNFNKAATIMISICMGLEALPGGVWSTVMLLAILGNIGSFTGFSLLKSNDKKAAADSIDRKSVV